MTAQYQQSASDDPAFLNSLQPTPVVAGNADARIAALEQQVAFLMRRDAAISAELAALKLNQLSPLERQLAFGPDENLYGRQQP